MIIGTDGDDEGSPGTWFETKTPKVMLMGVFRGMLALTLPHVPRDHIGRARQARAANTNAEEVNMAAIRTELNAYGA